MVRRTGPTPRPGYTMVELLVVILIISILAALTTAAVVRVIGSGQKASAASEISQLDLALTNFHKDHKFYPPSHVVDRASDGNNYIRRFTIPRYTTQPEYTLMRRMFSRWPHTTLPSDGITIDPPLEGAGTPLDVNQAMVYFLAGPRALFGPTFTGYLNGNVTFGWEKTRPYAPPVGGNTRIDPYYDFPEARLAPEGGTHDGRFRDPWNTPYAYFSSSGNNYDTVNAATAIFPWAEVPPGQAPGQPQLPALPSRTFASLGNTAAQVVADPPYVPYTKTYALNPFGQEPTLFIHPLSSNNRWLNEGKAQIISAGPDQAFGAGGAWVPGQAEYISAGTGNVGNDDIANFNAGAPLGETGR